MHDDQIVVLGILAAFIVLAVVLGVQGARNAAPKRRSPPAFNPRGAQKLAKPKTLKGRAYIVDGDTLTLKKTQIRLFGIDAPELDHPYGNKAKWALHKLCKGHQITATITEVDHYGRTVAVCYLPDGRDISAEMVKLGLALDWPKFSKGAYAHLETVDARKKLFLADARMKGHMHVWRKFEASRRPEA